MSSALEVEPVHFIAVEVHTNLLFVATILILNLLHRLLMSEIFKNLSY